MVWLYLVDKFKATFSGALLNCKALWGYRVHKTFANRYAAQCFADINLPHAYFQNKEKFCNNVSTVSLILQGFYFALKCAKHHGFTFQELKTDTGWISTKIKTKKKNSELSFCHLYICVY